MRGHIIKRYKNSYSIVINLGIDPATGNRKQQWISVKGTKKDAEKRLAELLHQLDTGTFMKPGQTILADYLKSWLKDYAYPNLSPRTAEGYEAIVASHIIPALGQVELTRIKPQHIQHYLAEKLSSGRQDGLGGLSPRTVRHHGICLHTALQHALKLGMIARNPVDAIELPKTRHQEIRTMNETDIHIFLEMARSTQYYSLFYTALFTGMRRSELLALKWYDIDLLLCQLSVTRTLHQLKNGEIVYRQPKTDKSRRLVALSPSMVSVLREHKAQQEKLRQSLGLLLNDNDLVFCHLDDKPLLPNSVTHAWVKLARRAGLKGIRLHDARHSHASLMLKQGIHPKIVQERLGHSSIQITLDTYSHVAPGLQQAAARHFDEILTRMPKIEDSIKIG